MDTFSKALHTVLTALLCIILKQLIEINCGLALSFPVCSLSYFLVENPHAYNNEHGRGDNCFPK